jgi:hypothetical protein
MTTCIESRLEGRVRAIVVGISHLDKYLDEYVRELHSSPVTKCHESALEYTVFKIGRNNDGRQLRRGPPGVRSRR